MIVIPMPGSDPYDHTDVGAQGEPLARALLGGFCIVAAQLSPGQHGGPIPGVRLEDSPDDELGHAALWLRGLVLRTFTEERAADLMPRSGEVEAGRLHTSWLNTHRFMCGLEPYYAGGVRICCRPCLVELLAGATSAAGTAVLAMFGGDLRLAHRYITGGGTLPVVSIPSLVN